jgi:hypothetical protein
LCAACGLAVAWRRGRYSSPIVRDRAVAPADPTGFRSGAMRPVTHTRCRFDPDRVTLARAVRSCRRRAPRTRRDSTLSSSRPVGALALLHTVRDGAAGHGPINLSACSRHSAQPRPPDRGAARWSRAPLAAAMSLRWASRRGRSRPGASRAPAVRTVACTSGLLSGARAPDGEFVVLDREVSVSSTSIPAARYSRSRGRTRVGRPALPNGVRAPSAARPPTRGRVEGGSAVPLPVKRPPRRQGS